MLDYIEYLNIPEKALLILVSIFFIMQIIGELLEFKGKVVPEFFKIRKIFKRRKEEKDETKKLLEEVKILLGSVDAHYSADNITKRNDWIKRVNDKIIEYDKLIGEISKISDNLIGVANALKCCTKMTEEMFVQSSRDRVIDFAAKAGDKESMVSKEEFYRIFKVYKKYEQFLKDHNMTNGEIDIAYRIIQESYEQHIKNHTFIEDVRGYDV